ncbi:ECF transporter S component [Metamycoplasma spumans]|uniref:ECF transporter S component n=1 Tax=Metamycoplasma spumans TaxID=92406 RepID=UPI0034DD1D06
MKLKSYKLNIYDISVFGIMLAIYIIASVMERYVFTGAFNIGITYAVFIIFGLALGPWKGALLGILCDTINQLIYGISTWMIEYAVVPAFIAFLSGWLLKIMFTKQHQTWILGYIFLIAITAVFISVLAIHGHNLPQNTFVVKRKNLLKWSFVLAVGVTGLTFIWITALIFTVINLTTRSVVVKLNVTLLFFILVSVFIILILTRWLWGPFAYINYHNRFRSGHWDYKEYFPIFAIPIMFKSLLEIPFYTVIIFAIFPVLTIIRKQTHFYSNKIHTY